jgi:hypothetical protein
LKASQDRADARLNERLIEEGVDKLIEEREARRLEFERAEAESAEELAARKKELYDEDLKAWKAAEEAKIALRFEYANAALGVLQGLDAFSSAVAANELARLEEEGASEEEIAKKKKQLAREAAIRDKALGLFSAGINTASAIVEALPNIPLSILAGVTGALQVATILATPLPAFANGGIVPGTSYTGDNVVARLNSGEEVLTTNDPRHKYNQGMNGGSGSTRVIVNLSGKPILDAVAKASKNGTMIIDSRSVK